MKSIITCLIVIVCLSSCDKYIETKVQIGDKKIVSMKQTKLLRHAVLFKFKETATKAQIEKNRNYLCSFTL